MRWNSLNLLNEKAKNLPSTPGVYLMKDSHGSIIYVGKSKNLKSRVQSYFYHSKAHSRKVEKLVKTLKDFDYIETDTEFEAFMLECHLIKEIKPYFNKLMKNPLSYAYIVIKLDEEIPKIEVSHFINKSNGSQYFGPFTSKSTAEKAIEGLKDCYKINCTRHTIKKSPCLNFTLGLCIGMCQGGAALAQYHSIMDKFIALLSGTDISLLEEMKEKMLTASEHFDFETAAKFRNSIKYIETLIHKERMIKFTEKNHNIVMLEPIGEGYLKIFYMKRNKILFSEIYADKDVNRESRAAAISANILKYFTLSPSPTADLTRDEIDEAQIIYHYLKSSQCRYIIISETWLESKVLLKNEIRKFVSPI